MPAGESRAQVTIIMKERAFLFFSLLCTTSVVAQEPPPGDLKQLIEEVRGLRERMAEKDKQIEELQQRVEGRQEASVSRAALDSELETLRAAIETMGPEDQKKEKEKVRIGGQLRWRFESRINFNFEDDVDTDIDFSEHRVRLQADVDIAEGLTGLIQVQDVRKWGEERSGQFGTLDRTGDGIDFHQGYAKLDIGEDGWLRFGRMELSLGHQRLVGGLDWAMVGRAFDGVHYNRKICDGDIDAFFFQLQEGAPSPTNMDAQFAGLYYTAHPFDAKKSDLDLYAFFLNDDLQGSKQERWTVGARWDQEYDTGLFWEVEGALQFGDSQTAAGNQDIPFGKVFAYSASVGVQLDCDWSPRLWAEVNHASGDNNAADGDNERFNTLFPTAHMHNGYADFTFWENTRNAALRLQVNPCSDVTLNWDNWYFAVDAVRDAIRGPAFSFAGATSGPRDAALESDLTLKWNAPKGIKVMAGYSFVHPLAHIERIAGGQDPAHWLWMMFALQF